MYRISNLVILAIVILSGLIQATSFDYIAFLGAKPDLLLALVVFFSLTATREESLKVAILAGLMKDVTSAAIMGSYTVSFFLIALILSYHQSKFFKEKISSQVMVTFASYILMCFFSLSISLISSKGIAPHFPFLSIFLKGGIYTGLISPLVFLILSKILRIRLAPGF
jgi:rod shape-determining protein MreD